MRETKDDIFNYFPVSDTVKNMIDIACMDCHSNRTTYSWYSRDCLVACHIDNGKEALNFSEFGKYPIKDQKRRFGAITTYIFDKQMPLPSFLIIHKDARLNETQRELIMNWADSCLKTIYSNKTVDPLKLKQ